MYPYITKNTLVTDVMNHPAFFGCGRLLFPWDDADRYLPDMTMTDMPSLHLWHTNMNVDTMVMGVNRLIDDRNKGQQIFYDYYNDEEKQRDVSKENTGLFFLRGKPGAPFAVVSAGGGFCYVGSLHEGFPIAMEINKRGYNVFVLKYRVGMRESVSARDLIAAVRFIREKADEFGVAKDDYSLWGGSAGARISSAAAYGEMGISESELLHPAATIIAYTTFAGEPHFTREKPAAFMIVGTCDWIVPNKVMEQRAAKMKKAGIPVKCMILKGVKHGFGTGKGMQAEGWLDLAMDFWADNMKGK